MREITKRGGKFRLGRHWITDDRTGIAHWDDEMVMQWDGLLVKKGSEETRHPQEYVRSLPNDSFAPQLTVPEQGINFDQFCGKFIMEYVPGTTIKRKLSQIDNILKLPGVGAMEIGDTSNKCGHWFVIEKGEDATIIFPDIGATNTSSSSPTKVHLFDAEGEVIEEDATIRHVINLPDGISSGDRLLVLISTANVVDFTWPTGWTELHSSSNSTVSLSVGYRDPDGSEGFIGTDDTITIITDVQEPSSHISYIIRSFDRNQAPEVSTGASGSSTSPDPDTITPIAGSSRYLFFAVEAHNTGSTNTTSLPNNYKGNTESSSR